MPSSQPERLLAARQRGAPDVDVAGARAHAHARDQAALNELVRVVAHDLAVLARAGLRLVGVHHQVGWPPVRHLRREV